MNLNYIRNYLEAKKDNITKEDITELISEIDTFTGVKGRFNDIRCYFRLLSSKIYKWRSNE